MAGLPSTVPTFRHTWEVDSPSGATFNLKDGFARPYFLVHLDHQVSRFVLEILDSKSGQAVGTAYELDFLPRSSTSTAFSAYAWDGTLDTGERVAEGAYRIRIKVLKALGDEANPDHWETWISPEVRIRGT